MAESDEVYDPCHGDPRAGWEGAHGVWEPCPVCDPPRASDAAAVERLTEAVHTSASDAADAAAVLVNVGDLRRLLRMVRASDG